MKTSKHLLLALSLTLFAINTAHAKGDRKRGKVFKELGLSSEQMDKVKSLRKEDKGSGKEIRKSIKEKREQIKKAFASSASDSDLRALHEDIKKLRLQKDDARFEKMLKIRSILTPEQRVKFQELKSKNRSRKKHSRD